jgi:hypothetical protein
MIAAWSFWSRPFRLYYNAGWPSPLTHLASWVLSVKTAQRHFGETILITDTEGAELLVSGAGLEFSVVSTELDCLSDDDCTWFAQGKLIAYRTIDRPFVHLDSDVYLWKPLPRELTAASLLAQSCEPFRLGDCLYRPEEIEFRIRSAGGWLPPEIDSLLPSGSILAGINCGIFGGNSLDFIRYYADLAISMIRHPDNQRAWRLFGPVHKNIFVEQYLLAACIAHHAGDPASRFSDVRRQVLFPTTLAAYDPSLASTVGFTHLLGLSKRNTAFTQQILHLVRTKYAQHYESCRRCVGECR